MRAALRLDQMEIDFDVPFDVQDLLFWRGHRSVTAVAGIDLEIRPGETLAIVGESGSGKTTLARAILGLVPIARGQAWLGEYPIHDQPDWNAIRRRVAMMFQDPVGSLSPRKSVRDLILEPLVIHGIEIGNRREKAIELISTVGLSPDFLDRYPHQLSGGQARRVGVARALAPEPELLLADEPTAGLDVSIQGEILNLLNRVKAERQLSTIIITHNLHILRHIADRIAVMYLGRIVELGDVEKVLAHPLHPYTASLLAATPDPDLDARGERTVLRGETPSLLARPSGCEFHPRCPVARPDCQTRAPVLRTLSAGRGVSCHYPLVDQETAPS